MSETKFTPGPWVIDYKGTIGHIKHVRLNAADHVTPTPTVCRYDVHTSVIGEDEQKANAHLIAAAPDLHDALHCLTEEVKKMKADIKNHPKMLGHLFEADAALEKARGKS